MANYFIQCTDTLMLHIRTFHSLLLITVVSAPYADVIRYRLHDKKNACVLEHLRLAINLSIFSY